jgi:23S rRNA (uracil1939-C5)-methyltransferase
MNQSEINTLHKSQEIEIEIESLAFGGQGLGHFNDLVVFVDQAIPGQKVRAKISKRKGSYAEAKILEVVRQSTHYTKARCPHFENCGGCAFQHLTYEEQIKAKQQQVVEILERLGGLAGFEVEPTLPSTDIYFYRNKMEFSFSRQQWRPLREMQNGVQTAQDGLYLGLHSKGFFDKVIDIQECHLLHPKTNEILQAVRSFARTSHLPPYSTRDHTGFWRFLVMRHAKNTGDLMVSLIASRYEKQIATDFTKTMTSQFPEITSLLYGISTSKAAVAFTEKEYLLAGKSAIVEQLGHLTFEISNNSFFQTNTRQAQRLYDVVKTFACLSGKEMIFDLYCGAGTISLYLSDHADRVFGFEAVESAIRDAHRNSLRNGVSNCQFIPGDLRDRLVDTNEIISSFGRPDVMVIDPPRGGMHPKTVLSILSLKPGLIVHVSCNPGTLARDLKLLCEKEYSLKKVRAIDMFPHTPHIEVVCQLLRR